MRKVSNLAARAFPFLGGERALAKEKVGRATNYNLYRLHPWLRLTSKGTFRSDTDLDFPLWLESLRAQGRHRAVILGNAPCLSELTPSLMAACRAQNFLSIGLNRSIYAHETNILLWSDIATIDELLRKRAITSDDVTVLHAQLERNHALPAAKDRAFQGLHEFWSEHRTLTAWPKTKLFMFRNSAVAALHLCQRIGITEVLMVGFGFDDRAYFYSTGDQVVAPVYEMIEGDKLEKNCGGYDTQKIVREVLESLIMEGMKISFNGPSAFLKTIPKLRHVSLDAFLQPS